MSTRTAPPRPARAAAPAGLVVALGALLLALLAAAPTARAAGDGFAPVDRKGPPLSVPRAELEKAIVCRGDFADRSKPAVLLVPGTFVTADEFYSWNLQPALTARGIPWCSVSGPDHNLGDISVAGQYDVHAIRKVHALAGRPIAVVGHSQGGMVPRWALRFWPDVRAMVGDQVGIAAAHHGAPQEGLAGPFTTGVFTLCAVKGCPPAAWQLQSGSRFLAALNSGREMFSPTSYSSIYSTTDEVVAPSSTELHGPSGSGGYRRVALQDVCPGHVADHLQNGTTDPVAFAMILDAIRHPGPVDPRRIDRATCAQAVIPGLDLSKAIGPTIESFSSIVRGLTVQGPFLRGEPALPCYVRASCPTAAGAAAAPANARPRARIRVRRAARGRVVLDGRRSRDADGTLRRFRWSANGRVIGRRARIVRRLPRSSRAVRVVLRVTDDDGATGTARRRVRAR